MGLLNNINNFFILLYQNINCYYICYNNKNNNSELKELLISEEKDNKYINSFEASLVQPNSSEYYLF
jgi:hypothetical protein